MAVCLLQGQDRSKKKAISAAQETEAVEAVELTAYPAGPSPALAAVAKPPRATRSGAWPERTSWFIFASVFASHASS